ncbi:MAG: fluoride efflux transporter CrcB [Candidatus Methylacidiphilales bacterium]|nr:fluoride efflux transporter CrcB [Candidatus Methylacidiphilales bacterium]
MAGFLWVGLGSACGGMARYALSLWAAARWGEAFPWGTLAVNTSGCLAMGFLAVALGPEGRWRELVLVGFLGGYTTFSAFSLQSLNLMRAGDWTGFALNVTGSVVLCLAAVVAGYGAGRFCFPGR